MAGILNSAIPASIWNNYSYLTFLAPSVGGSPTQILKADHFFMSHALLFKMCYTLRAVCLKLFLCIHTALELYAFSEAHTLYTLSFHSSGTKGRHQKNCFFTFSQETETPPPLPFLTNSVFSDKDFWIGQDPPPY